MAQKQDPNLVIDDSVKINKRSINDTQYRGFVLETSTLSSLTLKNVFSWYPFCEGTTLTGWNVQAFNNKSQGAQLNVLLHNQAGRVYARQQTALTSDMAPIVIPSGRISNAKKQHCHLTLRLQEPAEKRPLKKRIAIALGLEQLQPKVDGVSKRAFIAVHQVLNRTDILKHCQGTGIEIGPGHKPQVHASSGTEVTYIEQSAPADWVRLYNDLGNYEVDPELWANYKIGDACNLPVQNNSLDFIFSSHVFEHLANPLGHLQYWASKLKSKGRVLGIVPDIAGCKDYVYRPSPMCELLAEQASGDMEPTLEHYTRWVKYRRPGENPEDYYKAKRSIHVHYYTRQNMTDLLQYAVENLGYAWFDIHHTPNHKDFYFLLSK